MIDRECFVREHTVLTPVPLVPEIRVHTATEVVPLWRATAPFLTELGLGIPFWCVPWAGGQALARWVLDHPACVRGKSVLDFGSGSGLVAIAAAKAGAASVRAVDVDPFATSAAALNAAANEVTIAIACADATGARVAEEVLLAGDVWYEAGPAKRFARWFAEVAARGTRVLTGDPGRAYVPSTAQELATYAVPTTLELESTTVRTTRILEISRRARPDRRGV